MGRSRSEAEAAARLRRIALAWGALALAGFAVLALVVGVPQGPEGTLITGSVQTEVQFALLAAVAVGLLVALRWPGVGAVLIALAAAAIGIFAAFEYRPLAAFAPFAALVIPAVMLLAGSLRARSAVARIATVGGLALLLAGSGVAAAWAHDYAFGPTHPESTVASLPAGPVEWIWSGAPAPDGARVTARVRGKDAHARLLVSRRADLGSPNRWVEPSSRGDEGRVVSFDVGGLRSATGYHYAAEVDGQLDRARTGRFRTSATGPRSFTIAFGNCARRGSNGRVFDTIRAQRPDLFLNVGDFFYSDIGVDDPGRFRDEFDLALTRPGQQALYLSTPVAYVWDDHDYGTDGGDSTALTRDVAQAIYREDVPHADLPGGERSGPIYQSLSLGRVRFLLLDTRSERDPASTPDGPGKSMLGAAQRRWLEGELAQAAARRELAVIVSSVPWIDPARAGADDWAGYAHERASLSRAIARLGVRTMMIAGDAHMAAFDDGRNADYSGTGRGGFPVVHAAALDRRGGAKGGPYSGGAFPGTGRFGTMTVRDDGERIEVTVRALDWKGGTILSATFAVTP